MRRAGGWRSRAHPAYWAFLAHRISGLALAAFLPAHFWVLGQALRDASALEAALRLVDQPLFKLAEWGLVVLLALHAAGGVRILVIEFGAWSGLRKDLIAAAAGFGVVAGLGFALALLGG